MEVGLTPKQFVLLTSKKRKRTVYKAQPFQGCALFCSVPGTIVTTPMLAMVVISSGLLLFLAPYIGNNIFMSKSSCEPVSKDSKKAILCFV